MYNQDIYEKVCNISCNEKELTELSSTLSTTKFDLDHPFDKYYSVEIIIKAINKYLNGEITDQYLAHWMNTYNWIISASDGAEKANEKYTLKEYVEYNISNDLDTLSFFDEDDFKDIDFNAPEFCKNTKSYLNNFVARFKFYDLIYQNLNNLEIYYQIIREKGKPDELEFLCVNHQNKTYLFFDEFHIYSRGDQIEGKQLTETKFSTKIQELKQTGYSIIEQDFEDFA